MEKNIILLCGDIHGRTFWKKPCENIEKYDKIIFLGDYFDPYPFEEHTIASCINNFEEIIELKKNNNDKVILLLGNHDYPYYSDYYYKLSWYHCRHSSKFHNEISELFSKNKDFFKLAHVEDEILFTHAGVESEWLDKIVKCHETDLIDICNTINSLQNDKEGQQKLYYITSQRGGRDRFGSCIWADVDDIMWDVVNSKDSEDKKPIHKVKQIFGHTLQAFYDNEGKIAYGDAIEFENYKMVDTAKPYELNTEEFTIKVVD